MRVPRPLIGLLAALVAWSISGGAAATPSRSPAPGPALVVGPGDWPMYSRDISNSRANPAEKAISPTTAPLLQPAWTFPTGGDITGTPTVIGNHVFLGSDDHHVYDLVDRGSRAALVWKRDVGGEVNGSIA